MKQFIGAIATLLLSLPVVAGSRPEALQLQAYVYPEGGQRLLVYGVSCSDRREPQIVKTEGERRWCLDGTCFRDKMDAATYACARENRERLADGE